MRIVRESYRSMKQSTPYKKVPKMMVIALVDNIMMWFNIFSCTNGVSETMNPASIVHSRKKYRYEH